VRSERAGRDERIDWLFGWWRTIDEWVAERLTNTGRPR